MGLQIADLVPRRELEFRELKGKVICVDAFNAIYQFLSTIRQADGTPLMDSNGKTTSHLSGLFYRNVNLLSEGLKLVYVFDGKPPEQKNKTHEKRSDIRDEAREKYNAARDREDIEAMGRYSRQLSILTDGMIQESKELLESMGIAVVQAPSEGESQAAYLVKTKKASAEGSQDYDSLLFGAPLLIQNLTLSSRRKTSSGSYINVYPELIELERVLNHLQINLDQLICLGILVGTDYNPGGIKGIGPKKALEIVKKYKQPYLIFKSMENQIDEMIKEGRGFDWQEVYQLFHRPNVSNTEIHFPKLDKEKIIKILTDRDFSKERIEKQFEKLDRAEEEKKQTTLFSFK